MTSPCIVLCSHVRVKCSACMQCAAGCDQATARAVCRKCFTSIAIDRSRRSSAVVRSCQRSIASVSTASKRRHLLEVLPWLNFTPDTQQVQAERFSSPLNIMSHFQIHQCTVFAELSARMSATSVHGTVVHPLFASAVKSRLSFDSCSRIIWKRLFCPRPLRVYVKLQLCT